MITQRPQFTLGITHGVGRSVGLDPIPSLGFRTADKRLQAYATASVIVMLTDLKTKRILNLTACNTLPNGGVPTGGDVTCG